MPLYSVLIGGQFRQSRLTEVSYRL